MKSERSRPDGVGGADAPAAGGAEQRRWKRVEQRRTMQIHPVLTGRLGKAVATRVIDFSAMGVGLIHPGRMQAGEQFVITLGTMQGSDVPLLYSVVRCRGLKNGLFAIGAELVSVMDLRDLSEGMPVGEQIGSGLASAGFTRT